MIGLIMRPIRRRKAIAALAAYSDAKDAYRRAVVSGDTRRQHETLRVMTEAMAARLIAEIRLKRVSKGGALRASPSVPTAHVGPGCSGSAS